MLVTDKLLGSDALSDMYPDERWMKDDLGLMGDGLGLMTVRSGQLLDRLPSKESSFSILSRAISVDLKKENIG